MVLDEFSRFEARGEGLMPLWPAIVAARPQIVVVAVRSGLEAAIEERIGRRAPGPSSRRARTGARGKAPGPGRLSAEEPAKAGQAGAMSFSAGK